MTQSKSGLSEEFTALNFEVTYYKDSSGKKNKKYLLTKDGFTMVVMEFKTAKARKFKEAYIKRFNYMEEFIKSLITAKMEFPAFTEAISQAHEIPKPYHFSNEINMIYRIVLGADAKKFRELNGISKGEVIRPYLSMEQIQAVEMLQRIDVGLNVALMEFEDRKKLLNDYYKRSQLKAIA